MFFLSRFLLINSNCTHKICAVNIHLFTTKYTTMFIGRAVVVLSLPNMRNKYTFIYNKINNDVHRTSTPLPSKLCSLVSLSAAIYVQFKSVCILLNDAVTQTEKVKIVKHFTRGSKTIIQTASRLIVFLSFPVSFFWRSMWTSCFFCWTIPLLQIKPSVLTYNPVIRLR